MRAAVAWLDAAFGFVEDLAAQRWQFTQTLGDVVPEEWGGETVLA